MRVIMRVIGFVVVMAVITSCFGGEKQATIFSAIKARNIKKVQTMARKGEVNKKDDSGRTPLMLAAEQGDLTVVKVLLKEGADIDARDNDGCTVITRLESILNRSGANLQTTIENLREQGMSEKEISKLVDASRIPGDVSQEEIKKIKLVLEYLKKVKSAQEKKQEKVDADTEQ